MSRLVSMTMVMLFSITVLSTEKESFDTYENELPTEFLTDEIRQYLNTDKGKKLWGDVSNSLLTEMNQNRGDPQLSKFYVHWKDKNFDAAYESILTPAENGNSQAQTELGNLYLTGLGVKKDIDKAIQWFKTASQEGNMMATSILGGIYANPAFGRVDFEKSFDYFKVCAVKLRAGCVVNIASLYALEDSPEFDISKAFAWASLGADKQIPGTKDIVDFLMPYMDSALLKEAGAFKSAIIKRILESEG